MVEIPLLGELALVVALAVAVTVVLARLRLPTVAGLLAAGGLLGPFGLKLVEDVHAIELLAEVGVVLLLFTIGLEFSFSRLRHIFRRVALGGLAQVLATLGATVGVALLLGQPRPGRSSSASSWPCRARPSCCARSATGASSTPPTAASSSGL